ncbi:MULTISPECIES: hypothetical protein [Aquificales]|uniref:hypothetical protein n=1 Tax=Aquificales TaxID=32069 RepID=UPI00015F38BD|nr:MULTISPECIES: hypothetical protein [Aquificales]EDP73552.1 succinyl-diaminopimelate desuccinylase [Hydrogenivirga sp. 128-5-R1-1]
MIKIIRNIIWKFVDKKQSKIPNLKTQKVIEEARKEQNMIEINNLQELKEFIK